MKICILGNAQSKHITRWAEFFRDQGHTVHIVSGRPGSVRGVPVHSPRLPFESILRRSRSFDEDRSPYAGIYLSYVALAFRIRGLLKTMKPDLVMSMTLETNGILSLLSGFHPTALWHLGPKTLSNRSETSLIFRILTKWMLRFADYVYTADSAGCDRLVELGCSPHKIRIHVWGVDRQQFSPSESTSAIRRDYDAVDGPLVICVRPLIPDYDTPTYVKAIPMVLERVPLARFILVGDGPQRDEIRQLIDALRLRDTCFDVGYLPYEDLPKYLASSDVYVDPVTYNFSNGRTWWGHKTRCSSAGAGFTVTLAGAMSCGCSPVLTTRPGLSDLLSERFRRYMWQPGNPEDLAAKLSSLLTDGDELSAMRSLSLKVAEQEFDWQTNCCKTLREYGELVTGSASAPES